MKQIVHFGIYDDYTELEYGQYAALSSNSFETIKTDLIKHLEAQIVRTKDNMEFDWAAGELEHNQSVLAQVNATETINDLIESEYVHYEVIDLLGDFDDDTTNLD